MQAWTICNGEVLYHGKMASVGFEQLFLLLFTYLGVSTWFVRMLESMNVLPSETLDEDRFSPPPLATFARRDMYITAIRDSEVVYQGGMGNTRSCRIALYVSSGWLSLDMIMIMRRERAKGVCSIR